jgi:hypothetical protein
VLWVQKRWEVTSFACQRCGTVDPSLRLTVFPWVVSIVIVSFKRAAVGIFCSRCRSVERWKYLGISVVLGWWGIPWGIFWTLDALVKNGAGGQRPTEQNAALLAGVGQELVERGDRVGARAAWADSLALKYDRAVDKALLMLDAVSSAPPVSTSSVRPGDVVLVLRASNVMSSPDPASVAIASSSAGARHVVLARRQGWTQVRLNAVQSGWLSDGDVVQAKA